MDFVAVVFQLVSSPVSFLIGATSAEDEENRLKKFISFLKSTATRARARACVCVCVCVLEGLEGLEGLVRRPLPACSPIQLDGFLVGGADRKVVDIDEVATEFRMRPQEAIQRIKDLETEGRVSGAYARARVCVGGWMGAGPHTLLLFSTLTH